MEDFKDINPKFETGQRVVSSEHGEVKVVGSGRESNSYLVSKDGQEFEVYASTLTALGEEEEEETEETEE